MKRSAIATDNFVQLGRYLRINYSRDAIPTMQAQDAIKKQDPSRYPALHQLETQPRDRLTWLFITNTSRSKLPLAVMRNRLKRRWSEAFRQALLQKGYEHDGKRPAPGPAKARPQGLSGTLHVLVMEAGGWEEPMQWLVKQAGGILQVVEERSLSKNDQALRKKIQEESRRKALFEALQL